MSSSKTNIHLIFSFYEANPLYLSASFLVWVLYFFLVSFVQSPFKEALRDLSCSSDPSELPSPGKKGPRRIKTGEKLHRTEWLLFCPPASTTLAQSWDITAHNKSPFSIFKLNLIENWEFDYQYWESLILIFKISPYIPIAIHRAFEKVPFPVAFW